MPRSRAWRIASSGWPTDVSPAWIATRSKLQSAPFNGEDRLSTAGARQEAPARPLGDEGAVDGHRRGRRGRGSDVRDVSLELRFAPADARHLLRARAVRGRLRVAQARAVEPRGASGRNRGGP